LFLLEHDLVFAIAIEVANRSIAGRVPLGRLQWYGNVGQRCRSARKNKRRARFTFLPTDNRTHKILRLTIEVRIGVEEPGRTLQQFVVQFDRASRQIRRWHKRAAIGIGCALWSRLPIWTRPEPAGIGSRCRRRCAIKVETNPHRVRAEQTPANEHFAIGFLYTNDSAAKPFHHARSLADWETEPNE